MRTNDAIAWFKTNFGPTLDTAVAGTPFTIDMVTAIAYQETGYIWSVLLDKQLSLQKVLELSVGDTIDGSGRSAFPRGKGDLIAAPAGQEMFRRSTFLGMTRLFVTRTNFVTGTASFSTTSNFLRMIPISFCKENGATSPLALANSSRSYARQCSGSAGLTRPH